MFGRFSGGLASKFPQHACFSQPELLLDAESEPLPHRRCLRVTVFIKAVGWTDAMRLALLIEECGQLPGLAKLRGL